MCLASFLSTLGGFNRDEGLLSINYFERTPLAEEAVKILEDISNDTGISLQQIL